MVTLAFTLLAAVAASLPPERDLWVPEAGLGVQPSQRQVRAVLAHRGRYMAVYRDVTTAPAPAVEGSQDVEIAHVVEVFDELIFPRQSELFGPCPDRDDNGVVILLLTPLAGNGSHFFPFDRLAEAQARTYGFHSNEGEILYADLDQRGNRAVWNLQAVAAAFHDLLHVSHDPDELVWRDLLANYSGYLLGLAPTRMLWGDADPNRRSHALADPWGSTGWPLLFVHYLRERLGEGALPALVRRSENGFDGLEALLGESKHRSTALDLLADFSMACVLDDRYLGDGRLSFSSVTPPYPQPAARLPASRPTSGQLTVGVGGAVFIAIEGTGERALPVSLQGESEVAWIGRAALLRQHGPDAELQLIFDASGAAHLDLPQLERGDAVVLAVVAGPVDASHVDDREVALQCGLGWVPRGPALGVREELRSLTQTAFPDAGAAARARLATTIARLTGDPGTAPPRITTRYAWAPESAEVLEVLRQEATIRGLAPREHSFQVIADNGVSQQWHNLLVELPGADTRRWPVVVAAHWDAAHPTTEDSYLSARNLNDNASGVAVVLEAAAALRRQSHRGPILAALLAGGRHGAVGARGLLDELQGRVAAWVELDGVGIPAPPPRQRIVVVETGERSLMFTLSFSEVFKPLGLQPRSATDVISAHTGAALAAARSIPFAVISTPGDGSEMHTLPPVVERSRASDDLMVLIAKAVADASVRLAGGP